MKIKTLQAEQMLMDRLRAASRDILGPDATEAEVEADAKRAYEGPEEPVFELTAEEHEAWEKRLQKEIAEAKRAGVMDL